MTAPDRDGRAGDLREAVERLADAYDARPHQTAQDVVTSLRALLAEHPATPDVAMSVAKRHPATPAEEPAGEGCADPTCRGRRCGFEPAEVDAQLQLAPTSSKAGNTPAEECDHHPEWVNKFDRTGRCNHPDCLTPEPAEVAAGERDAIEALLCLCHEAVCPVHNEEAGRVGKYDVPCLVAAIAAHDAALTAKAKADGAREVLREAADEMWRIFLRLPHAPSPLGDYIQRRVLELRERADRSER